ncbi:DUF6153 family protein [Streptomyces sp. TRM 70361]|uniref:DUF6153 family protein n=1 Tax=Streptomyces sp. TRM 70361 TaxID=3116553 RepID=UPI002E7C4BB9|nr:DUF6153 family protein [Streptomyces sp. TRM 70361]MEE1942929.1 DUF6153 family protein [Streptomyces sp. TRM 70361]
MNRWSRPSALPPGTWARSPLPVLAALVLAVLAGLVAMHGLAPGYPGPPVRAAAPADHAAPAHHAMPAHGHPVAPSPEPVGAQCAHSAHGTGGHPDHADATCAAGGTSAAPQPPVLPATAAASPDGPAAVRHLPATTAGSRAPPSLSELQLLRI